MPNIDLKVMVNKLNVCKTAKLVPQKKRNFMIDQNMAVAEEVDKILEVKFIRQLHYPKWLSNMVLVRKANKKWRVYVDFTDLNKVCPKDNFYLPRIDTLVNSTSKHESLNFMDALSGYNQIQMFRPNQEKMSSITNQALYCYLVMPFRLKNVVVTYHRLFNTMFKNHIRRNMEVYVDDMLVESLKADLHFRDLEETFNTLRKYKMMLNLTKCVFGVLAEKFLSFMVSQRGIKVNLKKVEAIIQMKSP